MNWVKRYGPNMVGEMIELEHGLYVAARDYDKDTASLRADRDTHREMAGCMDLFRKDMIEAGVVGESCSPMFMTEGVLGYIGKLQAANHRLESEVKRLREALEHIKAMQLRGFLVLGDKANELMQAALSTANGEVTE